MVDKATKGVRRIFVYLPKPRAIHPDYPQTAKDVEAKFLKDFEAATKMKYDPAKLEPRWPTRRSAMTSSRRCEASASADRSGSVSRMCRARSPLGRGRRRSR